MEDKRARDPEKDLTFKGLCGGVSVDGGGGGGGGEGGGGSVWWGRPWFKPPYFQAPEVELSVPTRS